MFKFSNLLSLLFILCLSTSFSYAQTEAPVSCGPAAGGFTVAPPSGSSLCTNGTLDREVATITMGWQWACVGISVGGQTGTVNCASSKIDENVVPMDNEYSPGVGQSTQIEIDGTCQQITNNHTEKIYLPFEVASVTVANYNKLLAAGIISAAACGGPPVDGLCDNSSQNACLAGTPSPQPDTATEYNWICRGIDGGDDSVACSAPISYDHLFATSTVYNGNLGGINGANTICQMRATAAGLAGSFRAVLSDSKNHAKDMFVNINKLMNTEPDNIADLGIAVAFASGVNNPIGFDENGASYTTTNGGLDLVHTGSTINGTSATPTNCNDWQDGTAASRGNQGKVNSTANWVYTASYDCDAMARLYCTNAGFGIVNGNCSEVQDQCLAGTVANINGGANTWDCTGVGGGTTDNCSLSVGDDTIFVTSTVSRGDFGGINKADNECRLRASSASLPNANAFRAILSDSKNNAKDMFADGGKIKKTIVGATIADSISLAFSAGLSDAVEYDEKGLSYTTTSAGNPLVHTGSTANGDYIVNATCRDWMDGSNGSNGNRGKASESIGWLNSAALHSCDTFARFFCTDAAMGTVNGNCSTTQNICLAGTVTNINGGANTWDCAGVGGGATDNCGLPQDGLCGIAHDNPPPTGGNNLCAVGTIDNWTVTAPYEAWTCEGINGGIGVGCETSPVVNAAGACGNANGLSFPGPFIDNMHPDFICLTGTDGAVTGPTGGFYNWTCYGTGTLTGSDASCSATYTGGGGGGTACSTEGAYKADLGDPKGSWSNTTYCAAAGETGDIKKHGRLRCTSGSWVSASGSCWTRSQYSCTPPGPPAAPLSASYCSADQTDPCSLSLNHASMQKTNGNGTFNFCRWRF